MDHGRTYPWQRGEGMYGHLLLQEGAPGRRPVLEMTEIRGMGLLQTQVPVREGEGLRAIERRVLRAGRRLWEEGVNRVLVSSQFPHALWRPLERAGLRQVECAPLCRQMAAPLALAALARRRKAPGRAVVCLSGGHAMPELEQAAIRLAQQVGTLVIDVPGWGGALARWLHREFGIPLVEPGAVPIDLTVAFGEGGAGELQLWGCPRLDGLRLEPAEPFFGGEFAPLPLLSALWECGRLDLEELRVMAPE